MSTWALVVSTVLASGASLGGAPSEQVAPGTPTLRNPQRILSGFSQTPDPCPADVLQHTQGWIKIYVPGSLNFPAKRNAKYNPVKNSLGDPDKPNEGRDHGPKQGGHHQGKLDPFHIYLNKFTNDKDYPFVAVQVVIPRSSEFNFGTLPDIGAEAIAAVSIPTSQPDGSVTLGRTHYICTAPALLLKVTPEGRRVATFFVNLANAPTGSGGDDVLLAPSYNIILMPSGASETPIVIDPKIYNDG